MSYLARLYTDFFGGRPAIGLLIFRIVTGCALMLHAYPKLQHLTSWMPGGSVPAPLQALAGLFEFCGGLLIALGLLTPIACVMVACVMLGALSLVHIPAHQPWVGGKGGSMEPAIGYLAAAFLLFCTGPGRYSLDARILRNRLGRAYVDVERRETANVR